MLFGRESECAEVDRLLARAREGRSDALLLRGEAGIGKSALCDYAVGQAAGMTVLEACGAPTELELTYSGLADALQPVLGLQSEIPERQAAALASALAIGPPLESSPFTICAATLSLLAAAAEREPVLVVVDEAQWLDASSTQALLFAARRLEADGVAFLFALRLDGHSSLLERAELREVLLAPLEREAAAALLASRARTQVADEVADQVLQAAAGNPLALVELPGLLNQEQLAGQAPLEEELPTSATLERAFLHQVELLPAECREALLVAAASDSGDLDVIAPALHTLGNDLRSLEPAEEAGVISASGGRLQFRHPMLRAAIYNAAPSVARRAAHQAMAGFAGEREVDRRAWHLAAAAPAQDETAAEALEEAALAARRRGGRAEAASALERAAELGAGGPERARRLSEAAVDAWLVGRADHAYELLDVALEHAGDERLRARIQHRRGVIELWQGSPASAHRLLVDEAAKVQELDRARAAMMLTDAAWAGFVAAEITTGLETAQRACELSAETGGITETVAKAVLGIAFVLSGDATAAIPLFGGYLSLLDSIDSSRPRGLYQPLRPDGQLLTWFEQFDRAREVLVRTIDSARVGSALGALPYALSALSDLDFRTGNWAAAYAGANEAVRIADETHQVTTLAFSLSCLARVEAAQGREEECRVHSQRALEIAMPGISAVVALTGSGLGLLELGLGRLEEALQWLEPLSRETAGHGLREPAVIPWPPDLIETYVRLGRRKDAESALENLDHLARGAERVSALAAAARCRGLLAGEDGFEAEFGKALELHATAQMPFERARTELCLGERLRRARRRADARAPLRSALETFERLGATPWSERARSELAASGETARRRDSYAAEELTPQELQVALLVARGATNKEAGASLFLSPKTIEAHLGRVYRKLNVRSRTELAHLLGSEGASAGAAAPS